ncbi:hypothetical protein DEJ50_12065 [Streptomyces venezuelae]|uniref:Secreted protein n=1 Tax=Streptomyces venezuelae TaxID=54571 RepID=A0A5P2D546_STRVZ|nr:hypothetical protein [Streptomyces venezuelae]QES48441.1 hypothetical protein DEJ50_12065 [Streptomyces venezuelae]
MQKHHRAAALALAAVLTIPGLAACDAISTALDCASTAVAITDGANDLQQAISNSTNGPEEAKKALDQIEDNLKKIGDRTDNTDLGKAIDSMNTAVTNVRTAIDSGDATPDIKPVADAAAELSKVCTP